MAELMRASRRLLLEQVPRAAEPEGAGRTERAAALIGGLAPEEG